MKKTGLRVQTKEARKAMKQVAIRMFKYNKNRNKIANEHMEIQRTVIHKEIQLHQMFTVFVGISLIY